MGALIKTTIKKLENNAHSTTGIEPGSEWTGAVWFDHSTGALTFFVKKHNYGVLHSETY